MVARRPPPVSDSDSDADRERGRRLRRLEGEEMARAAAELRACAQRLPPESRIGAELAAWARRLAFAAEVHGLLEAPEDEDAQRD